MNRFAPALAAPLPAPVTLETALRAIAATAADRDRSATPTFPDDAITLLQEKIQQERGTVRKTLNLS